MLTQVRLVDGSNEMILRPREDIGLADYDWGFPDVRAATVPRTDADGEDDTTQYIGASAITMTLSLWTQTRAILDELTAYCAPSQRPYLYVQDDEWDQERRIQLRPDRLSRPITRRQGARREVQLSWSAPEGLWESVDEQAQWITATIPSTAGLAVPVVGGTGNTYAAQLSNSNSTGSVSITNSGNIRSGYLVSLYGPCTAPALFNDSTDQALIFDSTMVLAAGEYLEIDPVARTVFLNSDRDSSQLSQLVYATSSWWMLQRGVNWIRYQPELATVGSAALISTRARWI